MNYTSPIFKFNFSLLLLSMTVMLSAQSLPIDFENFIGTSDFIDFDGGNAMVIDNPKSDANNSSNKVAQIIRNGGEVWAGSKIVLSQNLDFGMQNVISMKVLTSAPVGTIVKFKLEGNGAAERDAVTTVSNEWEILTWDFTGTPSNFNEIVFMFDFGNVGDGTESSSFLFDDIEQYFGGFQIDFPVNFEEVDVNYTTTDFGGNISSLESDPATANNNVIKVIKTDDAATWAGTTIGTPAGFASNIPLTLTDSKMTVRVWSPTAGTPIRLKVEDSKDPTHTCETEVNTTLAGQWETLEFDFTNQAPGTELLSIGLSMGWTYNMASIFFNFGTEGAIAGEQVYYFDDVQFGSLVNNIDISHFENLTIAPNPTHDQWNINLPEQKIIYVQLYDIQGKLITEIDSSTHSVSIPADHLGSGIYFAKVAIEDCFHTIRLVKK